MQGKVRAKGSRYACVFMAALLLSLMPGAGAAGAETRQGAVPFADTLANQQGFMADPGEREILKKLQGSIAEAARQRDEAEGDTTKELAATKLAEAVNALTSHLDESDLPVRLVIDGERTDPHTSGPHVLPGRYGSVLLRVESGPGDVHYAVSEHVLDTPASRLDLDMAPTGTTYLLLVMDRLPVERSTFSLNLKREGQPSIPHYFIVETPPTGRLDLTVLSDDTGEPTPFMTHITSVRTGRDIRPPNFVDLSDVFDGQANATGHRQPYLPPGQHGKQKWWIVPGPFDLALDPGEYEMTISRGMEHAPLRETFTINSGEVTERALRPPRWIDMRDHGWYSGDDHVHCQIMSDDDADKVMAWIKAEDVHVANIVKMGDIRRTWFEQRGFGHEHRVIDGDYVLSPGQEGPRTHHVGHTLSMNTDSMVRDTDRYFLYDVIIDEVHEQGGLFGFAHVVGGDWNRGGAFNVQAGLTLWAPGDRTDFVEIIQFGGFGPGLYYDFLNLGFEITASSGSDVPWGGTVGESRVYAYIGDQEFSPDVWFDAVDAGHTFVTSGPMMEFEVNGALPGDVIEVDEGDKLRIKARAWGHKQRAPIQRIELLQWGEIIETALPTEDNPYEITLETELAAGHGTWLAARVYAANGSGGQTTPVYVRREGLRWWDYNKAPDLIKQRLQSLDELEDMAVNAKEKYAGEIPGDQHEKELGEQADAFLERVEHAREFYTGLQETHEKEAALRN